MEQRDTISILYEIDEIVEREYRNMDINLEEIIDARLNKDKAREIRAIKTQIGELSGLMQSLMYIKNLVRKEADKLNGKRIVSRGRTRNLVE